MEKHSNKEFKTDGIGEPLDMHGCPEDRLNLYQRFKFWKNWKYHQLIRFLAHKRVITKKTARWLITGKDELTSFNFGHILSEDSD